MQSLAAADICACIVYDSTGVSSLTSCLHAQMADLVTKDPANFQTFSMLPLLSASSLVSLGAILFAKVRLQIIRHARTHSVGEYQSCMFLTCRMNCSR